jgi:hypothetical protein
MNGRIAGMLLAVLVLLMTGCAPTLQSNRAELDARARKLRNIVMLCPDARIYELNAGGMREPRDEWSALGRENLEKAIIENLHGQAVNVKILKVTSSLEDEVDEVKTLYREVMVCAYTHTLFWDGQNPNFFPDRLKKFDYSVGSLEKLLKMQKADGLLLVHAEDEISSTGRKALRVFQAINPFGTAGRSGATMVNVAVADRQGDIVWNDFYYNSGDFDLRNPDSTRDFVKVLMEGFPKEGK